MGMSTTLNASVVVFLHERALRSRFVGELVDKCSVSLPVAQFSPSFDADSRGFRSGSDTIGVSARKWCTDHKLLRCADGRNRLRNELDSVNCLCRSLGMSMTGRGVRPEQVKRNLLVRAAGDKNGSNSTGDDPVETLFMRELRRRGISSDSKGSAGTDTRTKPNHDEDTGGSSERGWSQQGGPKTQPPPNWTVSRSDDQLKRSMALNSEGLEGLIPRAKELLKLGGSFWIVFWPLILASVATFITLYVYFGSNFLHTGNSVYPGGRRPYIEPYQLLEEETIPSEIGPNRVPFRSNPTP